MAPNNAAKATAAVPVDSGSKFSMKLVGGFNPFGKY